MMMTIMMTGVYRVVFGLFVFGLRVFVAFHYSVVKYFWSGSVITTCVIVKRLFVVHEEIAFSFLSSQICASKLVHILPLWYGFVNNHGSAFEQVAFIEILLGPSHCDFLHVAFIEILLRLSHCHFLLPSRMDREVWFD